jgi:hypothetical protein
VVPLSDHVPVSENHHDLERFPDDGIIYRRLFWTHLVISPEKVVSILDHTGVHPLFYFIILWCRVII